MKPPPSDESPPNPAFGAQSNRPRSDSDDDDQAVEPALVFVDTAADGEGDAQPPMEHIGRYTLRYRIGEGRLGTLYAAYDPVLSRLVAVKTVQPALDAEERVAFNSVFLNEARAAASLSHPYIATVYDAGISEQGAYVAMELLKGGDLRQLGVDGWRPSPKQAAMIVQRVADALAYAHSRGVVHCDIKPANIFMVGPTQPRVLDFGIARLALAHEATAAEESTGSALHHLAPEQVLQQPLDGRCDVFSLGVLLYELLTNAQPFQGNNLDDVTRAVLQDRAPLAHELVPDVPKTLSELAAWAMAKDPNARLPSASVMARELGLWLAASEPQAKRTSVLKLVAAAWQRHRWLQGAVATGAALSGLGAWLYLSPHTGARLADLLPNGRLGQAPPVGPAPASAPKRLPVPVSLPITVAAPAASVATQAAIPASSPQSTHAAAPAPTAAALAAPEAISAASPASALEAAPAPAAVEQPQPAIAAPTLPEAIASAATPASAAAPAVPAAEKPPAVPAQRASKEASSGTAAAAEVVSRNATGSASAPPAAAAIGLVRIAVSPWGQVEVDGVDMGTAPPLRQLTLSVGKHTVTLRNADFPSHRVVITVTPGRPINVKHKFGS